MPGNNSSRHNSKKRQISRPNRNDVLCGRGEAECECIRVCILIRLINIISMNVLVSSYLTLHGTYLTYIYRISSYLPDYATLHTTTHNITATHRRRD